MVGVSTIPAVPETGVVVGGKVLRTNKSGVWVGSKEYGVTVG